MKTKNQKVTQLINIGLILFIFILPLPLKAEQKKIIENRLEKILIAHRGASSYLPEHTLESVVYAHALNADYVEPDVVLTKDDVPIVLHDLTLDETTNVKEVFPEKINSDGHYYAIDLTLNEIKQLKISERHNNIGRFPRDVSVLNFQVPTLEEYISLVLGLNMSTGRNVGIYLELKNPEFHTSKGHDLTEQVWKVIGDYKLDTVIDGTKPLIIESFSEETLVRLRKKLKCNLPLVLLIDSEDMKNQIEKLDQIKKIINGVGVDVHWLLEELQIENKLTINNTDYEQLKSIPRPYKISPFIELAHKSGLFVHVYTFKNEFVPASFLDLNDFYQAISVERGADGIFIDSLLSIKKIDIISHL